MLNSDQREQSPSKYTFQHNHSFDYEGSAESVIEPTCSCKACLIQHPLVSKLSKVSNQTSTSYLIIDLILTSIFFF